MQDNRFFYGNALLNSDVLTFKIVPNSATTVETVVPFLGDDFTAAICICNRIKWSRAIPVHFYKLILMWFPPFSLHPFLLPKRFFPDITIFTHCQNPATISSYTGS